MIQLYPIIFCSPRLIADLLSQKNVQSPPLSSGVVAAAHRGMFLGVVVVVGQNSENRSGEEERGKTAQGGQTGASITVGERQSL